MGKRGIKLFDNTGILTSKTLFMQADLTLSHVHQWLTGSSYYCVEKKKGEEKGKTSDVLKYEHSLIAVISVLCTFDIVLL